MAAGLALLLAEAALRIAGFSHPDFYRPDLWRGWTLRPGAEGPWRQEGASWVRINGAGLRDEEHPEAKPRGELRIAVLGDSCVEALQVPHEETFAERLERDLAACPAVGGRRVEALNFGVSGYGTAQELLTLEREAWRFHPDLVLLAFYPGNDVANNSRVLEANRLRPFCTLEDARSRSTSAGETGAAGEAGGADTAGEPGETGDAGRADAPGRAGAAGAASPALAWDFSFRDEPSFRFRASLPGRVLSGLVDRSRVLQLAKPARVAWQRWRADRRRRAAPPGAEAGLDDAIYRPPRDPRWAGAWQVTEALIRRMRDSAREHGAGFGVAVLTSGIEVHPDPAVRRAYAARLGVPDLLYPGRRLAAFGRAEGIPVLALGPPLADLAAREHVFLHGFPNTAPGLGHWNARGHEAASRLLAAWLCREGFLPPTPRSGAPGGS